MREKILHYIWKFQKFKTRKIRTKCGKVLSIKNVGLHNKNAGPDFLNACIEIGEIHWYGQVEIHVNASDWYQHGHQDDDAYNNVILHAVWHHDADIYRKDKSIIPVVEMRSIVSEELLLNYQTLYDTRNKWINCEKDISSVPNVIYNHWMERLFVDRIQRKTNELRMQLTQMKYNWEEVLFHNLCKSFGLKLNSEAFFSMAKSLPYSIVQKNRNSQFKLEALFLGQSHLLESDASCNYLERLKSEFKFLRNKYRLENEHVVRPKFFRLRPINFPTIRLSQLAQLYTDHTLLFSSLITNGSLNDVFKILSVSASTYWDTHYTFKTGSKELKKTLSKKFVEKILINTIVPMKFAYNQFMGKDINDSLLEMVRSLAGERNSIVNKFKQLRSLTIDALESQALVELKLRYCDKNKCLDCEIGNYLLNRNM